jgi:hypothetical protein
MLLIIHYYLLYIIIISQLITSLYALNHRRALTILSPPTGPAGAHLIQLMRCGRFQLYDYGSPAANSARYGAPAPPDVAALYPLLAGLPVDLVAGRSDGVIAREDVVRVSASRAAPASA